MAEDAEIVEAVAQTLHGKLFATVTDWRDEICEWGGLHADVQNEFRHVAGLAIAAARPLIERAARKEALEEAWRDGWRECKARLTDDEAFCLTDDVEGDAWLDSATRRALDEGGGK